MIVKLVTHTYFFLHLSSKWGYTACEMLRFTSIVEFSAACSMHSFIWQRSKSRVISCTEHKQSHWFHTYYMSTTEPPIHQPTCFTNPYIPFHTSPLQSFLYSEAKTIPYTVKKTCAKCMSFWQLTLLALSLEVTAFNFAWHHPETLCIRMSLQRNKRNKEVYTNYPRGVNFPGSLIQLFENFWNLKCVRTQIFSDTLIDILLKSRYMYYQAGYSFNKPSNEIFLTQKVYRSKSTCCYNNTKTYPPVLQFPYFLSLATVSSIVYRCWNN